MCSITLLRRTSLLLVAGLVLALLPACSWGADDAYDSKEEARDLPPVEAQEIAAPAAVQQPDAEEKPAPC